MQSTFESRVNYATGRKPAATDKEAYPAYKNDKSNVKFSPRPYLIHIDRNSRLSMRGGRARKNVSRMRRYRLHERRRATFSRRRGYFRGAHSLSDAHNHLALSPDWEGRERRAGQFEFTSNHGYGLRQVIKGLLCQKDAADVHR